MSGDEKASIIHYLYSDAGNYKFWGKFAVLGIARREEIQLHLFDGEFFLPNRVGLATLTPTLRNDDDHDLHLFHDIEFAEPRITPTQMHYDELLRRLKSANDAGWF